MISSTRDTHTTLDVVHEAVGAAPSSGVTKPTDALSTLPLMASTGGALDSHTTLISDELMNREQEAFATMLAPTRDMRTFRLPTITTLTHALDSDTDPAAQKDSINALLR